MRILSSIILILALVLGAYGQDDQKLSKRELRQLQREQRKAEEAALLEQQMVMTRAMVEQQRFVLEATFLSDKTGQRVPVQSTINFIMIDSTRSSFQFGSAMTVGYNGVGGATFEGNVTSYSSEVIGKRKDSYSVTFNVMTSLGTFDFTLLISADGSADAQIRGNWGSQLNYHGKLVPLELSRVYKAMPLY